MRALRPRVIDWSLVAAAVSASTSVASALCSAPIGASTTAILSRGPIEKLGSSREGACSGFGDAVFLFRRGTYQSSLLFACLQLRLGGRSRDDFHRGFLSPGRLWPWPSKSSFVQEERTNAPWARSLSQRGLSYGTWCCSPPWLSLPMVKQDPFATFDRKDEIFTWISGCQPNAEASVLSFLSKVRVPQQCRRD